MKLLKKILLTIVMLTSLCTISLAQSNGDKLFKEGQILQQTQTIASQNKAIKKFEAAKVVYTSADKKEMCDNQIKICKNNINLLKKGGGKSTKTTPEKTEEKIVFGLSQNNVEFAGDKSGSITINVQAVTADWNCNINDGVEGEDNFLVVNKSSDGKSLEISTDANPTTLNRTQTINVNHEDKTLKIKVTQKGKTVKLTTNTSLVEFGLKGGHKNIELYTNSDSIVTDNNDLAWYVESKPDWLEVAVDAQKKKSVINKVVSKTKDLVSGQVELAKDEDVKTSNIKIVVVPLIKSDEEYKTGRRGDIIFACQDKRIKIIVVQQK